LIKSVKLGIEGLRTDVQKKSLPENKMDKLFERLAKSIKLLENFVAQKIIQDHHISKIIWAAVALFLVLCLVSAGWYSTYKSLDSYKANDTK